MTSNGKKSPEMYNPEMYKSSMTDYRVLPSFVQVIVFRADNKPGLRVSICVCGWL